MEDKAIPEQAAHFRPGESVGDYRIVEPLGHGAAGRVFKVEHEITRRVEAMKVLMSGRPDQQEMAQRFLREIQVQARLDHPNIASVLNAMWVDDDLVMVMELVDGEALSQKLERGRLPLDEALGYARQTLAALEYAHARKVIHRDISTANIIVTTGGAVKLTDFGLARMEQDTRLTQNGVAVGSLHYMSPEAVKAKDQPDARSDIYSVGAVLYELATGRKVFDGDSVFTLMVAQVQQRPKPPVEVDPSLPKALSDAILKALEKDPARRFRSAGEFKEALERVTIAAAFPAAPSAVRPAASGAPERTWPLQRLFARAGRAEAYLLFGRRGLYAGVGLAALLGVGLGLFRATRPGSAPPTAAVQAEIASEPLRHSNPPEASSAKAPVKPEAEVKAAAQTDPKAKTPDAAKGDPAPVAVKKLELPPAPEPPRSEPPSGPGFQQGREVPIGTASRVIALSPDGRLLAVATESNTVDIWDAGSGTRQASLAGHSSLVTSLAFSPDGRSLASGGRDGTARVWDVAGRAERRSFELNDPVRALAISPDGKWLATGSHDKKIKLWNLADGESRELKERMKDPQGLAFSPNGQTLVSVSGEKTARLWSTAEGKLRSKIGGADNAGLVAFSPDGNLVATAGGGKVRVVDAASGDEVQSLSVNGRVESLTFTRGGQCVAVATSGQSVELWNVTRGIQLRSVQQDRYVQSAALGMGGRRLAVVKDGGTAAILDGNPAGGPIVPDHLRPSAAPVQKEGFRLRSLFRRSSP